MNKIDKLKRNREARLDYDRKKHVITDWSSEIKENVTCTFKDGVLDLSMEERVSLYHDCKRVKDGFLSDDLYKSYTTIIYNVFNGWPETVAFSKIREFLLHIDSSDYDKKSFMIFCNDPCDSMKTHCEKEIQSSIYIPVWPMGDDYASIDLYYKNQIIGVTGNHDLKVYLWNSQTLHSVFNNEHERFNVQLRLTIPYKEMVNKYRHLLDI